MEFLRYKFVLVINLQNIKQDKEKYVYRINFP